MTNSSTIQMILTLLCAAAWILSSGRSVAPTHAREEPRSGTMIALDHLGGGHSAAQDINNRGQVVGWSGTADGRVGAFLWSAATGMVDLGTLGGPYSYAHAIVKAAALLTHIAEEH